ncbi:hypothetical protein ITJ53_11950 [Curtobacterium sp. VKM Ac-1796]|uniref:hypothetical protein n=1 Tax=Curtobacterium sp. VKM Ac-1796 TaxID=2783816 RepID=UPI00188A2630|nr:hypothetical protein [Curtobacterium sp. VKM Ac-1796]MBF4598159.1 hypothetical protein [Curtobacterium sp. VKM Ac-1796]
MTTQFSVINNTALSALAPASPTPRPIEQDARELLAGRQFHVCGDNVLHAMDSVSLYTGGIFAAGTHAMSRVQRLQPQYPTVPMIAEPTAVRNYWATEDAPFLLDRDENDLIPPNLDWHLSMQRMAGSALAMTPTGQIKAGDSRTLKNALREANAIDRDDVLFTLPLSAGWLSNPDYARQVVKVIDRSRHPVALTFTDKKNPLESRKRMRAYRRLITETTGTVLAYRVDMFGFDAVAHGAIASAIGAYPSVRRLNPVGTRGSAIDPEDMAPHMLVGDMLRFVRTKQMRRVWFAEAEPFVCFCTVCDGQPIDRLFGTDHDRNTGHLHNLVEIGRLHDSTTGLAPSARLAAWDDQVKGALDTYPQLETHTGRPLPIPTDLEVWAEPVS